MSSRVARTLQTLRAALLQALEETDSVSSVISEVRRLGLPVYLVIDDPEGDEEPQASRLFPSSWGDEAALAEFKMDQDDVRMLRDLGIDPTRTLRRGRRARRR